MVARLISKEDFGIVSYAVAIVTVLTSVVGGRMDVALLRYGAVINDLKGKQCLFHHTFSLASSHYVEGRTFDCKQICLKNFLGRIQDSTGMFRSLDAQRANASASGTGVL